MGKKRTILILTAIVLLAAGSFAVAFFGRDSLNRLSKKMSKKVSYSSITDLPQQNNEQQTIKKNEEIKTLENPQIENKEAQTIEPNEISKVEDKEQPQPAVENKQTEKDNNDQEKSSASLEIKSRLINWGYQIADSRNIDTIIVHSSYDAFGKDPYSIEGIVAEYKQYGVSAHYLIGRDGTIYQLVAEKNIAYHAGVGKTPDGRSNVNAFSIGIEMVNTQEGKFTDAQYGALNKLIAKEKQQYKIKYVLGHDDIAPGRKTDPWNIDWNKIQR